MRKLILCLLFLPLVAPAEVLFEEDFTYGDSPFSFEEELGLDSPVRGQTAYGGEGRRRVWLNRFDNADIGHAFGHALTLDARWAERGALHWAGYVKFGYLDDASAFAGDPFAIAFPVIGSTRAQFVAADADGSRGKLLLRAADGSLHEVMPEGGFMPNRWYGVEVGLTDNPSGEDRVRVWIDNPDETAPDLDYSAPELVDAASWPGTRIAGRRGAGVPAGATFYYDDIRLGDAFIGLQPADRVPPAAPTNLTVE